MLALGGGTGWYWWTDWRFQQSTDDAYVQSDITVISPKVEGYIKEVRVEENQPVDAGQVLFVVDDRDFAAKVAQAEAAVATEEASVLTYDSRMRSAAGDDRAGEGGGRLGRGRPGPHPARLPALYPTGGHRFRQPAALGDGRGR